MLQKPNDLPVTVDSGSSFIEFSSSWEVLGPFQIGTRGLPQRKAISIFED